jgi:hypothetical protein
MIKSNLPLKARRNNRSALRFRPELEFRLPLPVVRSLLANQLAYRQLLAEHQKALSVLAIHAADDAGA